jgi:hypothetical protein
MQVGLLSCGYQVGNIIFRCIDALYRQELLVRMKPELHPHCLPSKLPVLLAMGISPTRLHC